MKFSTDAFSLISAVTATVAMTGTLQAATILTDTFGTSTLNAAVPAAPTGTSTNYQVLSSKNATGSSIASGSLKLNTGSTSSGFSEIQALFAASPVVLANTGDYVQLSIAFTASGVNIPANTASSINFGLYNSGGNGPVSGTNLNNAQLDDNPGPYSSGNAAGWLGYVSRIGGASAAGTMHVIYERPAQVAEVSNEAQDLLFANAGGGAFNQTGSNLLTGGAGVDLSTAVYTLVMTATRNGTALDVSYSLSDTNGVVSSLSGSDATPLTSTFDGLAFGYRASGGGPYGVDVGSITVTTNVPEPASLSLLTLCGLTALRRRRA